MRKFVLSSILLFFLFAAKAQDVRTVLQKVHNAYGNANVLRTQLAYRYYDKAQDKNFVLEKKVQYTATKNAYLYKLDNTEQLYNGKYRVFIDHDNEVIGVAEKDSAGVRQEFSDLLFHPDSALKQCKKYVYQKSNDKSLDWCSFYFDSSGGYSKIDFFVEAGTGYISKIIVHLVGYDDEGQNLAGSRIEILVLKTEKNISLPPGYFSESRFFTRDKQNFKLNPLYRKYTLLN